jgi:IclR family pca regulon transcriptional regulator
MTDGPGPPALTPGQFVQSLERGLAVIRSFDAANPEMTLSDVAARSALSRATARRFLLTLVELGYVRTDGKRFALTARVLELGYAYLSSLTLPEIAQPHLETLSATVHESSSASVLDGTDVVYVARVPVKRIMTVSITLGTRLPAFATAMGRAILGHLDDAKRERTLERRCGRNSSGYVARAGRWSIRNSSWGCAPLPYRSGTARGTPLRQSM